MTTVNKSKHTPGPQEFDGTPAPWRDFPERDGFRRKWIPVGRNSTDPVCLVQVRGEDSRKNARLIAAAPELLEACRAMLDCMTNDPQPVTLFKDGHRGFTPHAICATQALREAITKATGNT